MDQRSSARSVRYIPVGDTIRLPIAPRVEKPAATIDGLQLRQLKVSDSGRILRFRTGLYDESRTSKNFFQLTSPPEEESTRWVTGQIVSKLARRRAVAVVAEINDRIEGLGYIGGQSRIQRWPYLSIYISEGYRSMGLGSMMMGEMVKQARERFSQVWLSVESDNHRAKRLYAKFGFKPHGISGEGLERMRLILRS